MAPYHQPDTVEIDRPPLTPKQDKVFEATDPDLLIEGSPRSAKSWAVAAKIHRLALEYPGIQIFYSRYKDESLGQLRDVWNKVMPWFPTWSQPKWNSSDQSWDYLNPEGTPAGKHWGSKVWLSSIKSSELDTLHSKYKGKTLAVVVVEEASELPKENWVGLQERLSQSKKPSGEPFAYPLQFILVTNAVDEDHWLAAEYPDDGMDVVKGRRTIRFGLYDNAKNLGPTVMMEYERRYPIGHPLRRTVVEGLRGLTMMGSPVYGEIFDKHTHVNPRLAYNPYYPLLEGWDFGEEKPAVVWWQYLAHLGAIRILGGVKGSHLFLETFAPKALAIRRRLFPTAVDIWSWADPTGATGNQGMQHTAIRHLQGLQIHARIDPTANAAPTRYAAIQVIAGYLERVAKDGSPAFQMVPTIVELKRKDGAVLEEETGLLVTAFGAGYVWDEHAAPDANPNIRKPKKGTRYDDLMNAGEYIVIGERLSVPLDQEMWQADRKVAATAERVARAAVASTQRVEGPTGETIAEAEARLLRELRQFSDVDRRDHARQREQPVGGRGGY